MSQVIIFPLKPLGTLICPFCSTSDVKYTYVWELNMAKSECPVCASIFVVDYTAIVACQELTIPYSTYLLCIDSVLIDLRWEKYGKTRIHRINGERLFFTVWRNGRDNIVEF